MPTYRIYILTKSDHIYTYKAAECYNDRDAIALAEELLTKHPWVEIWCGDQMVWRQRLTANDAGPETP